jgi:hypothetical protein
VCKGETPGLAGARRDAASDGRILNGIYSFRVAMEGSWGGSVGFFAWSAARSVSQMLFVMVVING